jgi:hypothetical protein
VLPAVLSTTAGAVDVIGFLALGRQFTGHSCSKGTELWNFQKLPRLEGL